MIVACLIEFLIGLLCIGLGLLVWLKRKITLVNESQRQFVKPADIPVEPAAVTAITNMFWTNWICVARETAVISSWAILPSISASQAATAESIRLWKAIGRASFRSFR